MSRQILTMDDMFNVGQHGVCECAPDDNYKPEETATSVELFNVEPDFCDDSRDVLCDRDWQSQVARVMAYCTLYSRGLIELYCC
jgi:hypothetical protein